MSRIAFLLLVFFPIIVSGDVGRGLELMAKGEVSKGAQHLEKIFQESDLKEQSKIALILSRTKNVKLENSPIYYSKYALKFLEKSLNQNEIALLNIELADYYLVLGNLITSRKYYENALKYKAKKEIKEYAHYRLGWVYFNQEKYLKAKDSTLLSLASQNIKQRDDALYLLGQISLIQKLNLDYLKNQNILNNDNFLKAFEKSESDIVISKNMSDFTSLFFVTNTSVKNSCDVLKRLKSKITTAELDKAKMFSFMKKCLLSNQKYTSDIDRIIKQNAWHDVASELVATSYLVKGQRKNACRLYKKNLYEGQESSYKGFVLSCNVDTNNVNKIVHIKSKCEDYKMFTSLNGDLLTFLSSSSRSINTTTNQALLLAVLYKNLNHPSFEEMAKKLTSCSLQKDVYASFVVENAIDSPELIKDVLAKDYYAHDCKKNSGVMNEALYLSSVIRTDKLSTVQYKCLDKGLSHKSKMKILASLDYSKINKKSCYFDFDCLVRDFSGFIQRGGKLKKPSRFNKSLKKFLSRINVLIKTKKIANRGVTSNNIELLYAKVKYIKRAFIDPPFYNDFLMKKLTIEYNSLVDSISSQVNTLTSLNKKQIIQLSNAINKQKVVI